MNEKDARPDPEELLTRIHSEEQRRERGNLKIFMGYAAGVGKTYAMLEAARQRQAENVDVVIAYVETHKRLETEALLQGLEILPRKTIEYHGLRVGEMDVDLVLRRRPKLAVVDELAHTNAPGSRHPKRFQDVEELLAAGIDVYTTLNVQHLESLNDVIRQITGITVHETVPDHIVDEADEIELIDLAPDELLQRLKEGKVYVPEQAVRAIHQFFRKGNLTALREISMRRAAHRVDVQMRDYMETKAIPGPWPAKDRLMVAISTHPLSERLVRAGRRLAEELDAEWFVVYVETPERLHFSPQYSERLGRILRLAESLGGKVMTVSGRTVPEAIIEFAHKYNITKIIAGKPLRPRWYEWLRGSLLDEIIRNSGPIDVYVISDQGGPLPRQRAAGRPIKTIRWRPYLFSLLTVALITGLGFLMRNLIEPTNLAMVFLAGVVFTAVYLGRGPSMLASLLSALSFDFFFVDPHYTFTIADTQYIITFLGLLVVSAVVSNLAGLVRNQLEASQRQAALTSTLYGLSRDLTQAVGLEAVLRMIVTHISQTFSREVIILLPHGKELEARASSPDFILDENEGAVATWAFEHNQSAGRGTDTLSGARIRYQPLVTAQGVVGVIGVKPGNSSNYLTPEQRQLLDAYANLAALAIERTQLAEQASQAQVLQATEKLQTALLNSISHDLRTPLVAITGALDNLLEAEQIGGPEVVLDQAARIDLLQTAHEEADRLNRLVGNLLNMTRLESGAMKLSKSECDVQDLIGVALRRLSERLQDHPVQTVVAPNLPLVQLDFVLMDQVLTNLLDNAAKYSEAGKPIEIQASRRNDTVLVTVSDRGIGIPADDLTRVFDKFFRVQRRNDAGGTGLGLSICKGIVEAHGGRIWAENRPGGGTVLAFTVPLGDQAPPQVERNLQDPKDG
ncbi:MAG: sensor histidine kinase KdpD [Chloroflexi bacterium]|nr:sensor histidine kinase KdpD [Chloroflexota bacterium]